MDDNNGLKIDYNSQDLIGDVKKEFDNLNRKNYHWNSFYSGWIHGRANLLFTQDISCPFCGDKIKLKFILKYFRCYKCNETFTT